MRRRKSKCGVMGGKGIREDGENGGRMGGLRM